uniref:E3 ubiquitin-protein ligase CHFR n=1 Tax=Macrostomum lignano TaxID=282301 RepID=A0A1I8HFM0_9PLAT
EAWAQLFNTSDGGLALELLSDRCQIGRAVDCDLSLAGNQFVSGHHCAVFKDPDGGVWLQDTSMNGTLVNGRRILGDVAELRQDDVITVCPLPGNSTRGTASNYGPDQPAIMLAADPSTVSKVPTVSADAAAASASASASSSASGDPMEANLNCTICCEIFHDCVTLIPCLHGYCAGCYSQWRRTNPVCPQCRVRPERVTKNVLVTNLAEAYLAAHPERRRPAEELEKLDSLNDIGRQEAFPVVRQSPADEDESDEEDEDSDDDGNAGVAYFGMNQLFGFAGPYPTYQLHRLATPPHLRHVCRQCPGYQPPDPQQPLAPLRAAGAGPPPVDGCPHLDDLRWEPLQVAHVCPDNQAHLLCQCCWQAFPDRRADPSCPAENRRFQCALCQRFFCHAYWGCRRPGCLGCLAEFEDFTFGRRVLEDVVNGNPVESKSRPDTPVCYACGQACLRELALAYRSGLPAASLPAEAASRPNCHWGSECRTQFNKPEHAKRFNHACRRT